MNNAHPPEAAKAPVLFCAMEVAPFSKVGGLGDVVGSLPMALHEHGWPVAIYTPLYSHLLCHLSEWTRHSPTVDVTYQDQSYRFTVYETTLPDSTVPVYLFDHPLLFGQYPVVYPDLTFEGAQQRYDIFAQGVIRFVERQHPQGKLIFHAHDWHTANLVTLLKSLPDFITLSQRSKTVLTIHNLAYQGATADRNPLYEGLRDSDWLTTVSPTYAQEILTPAHGEGLDALLRQRKERLTGILNGLDTHHFDPATDPHLPHHYTLNSFAVGKAACKQALQTKLGLPTNPNLPLFGMVTRLVEQKGLDILLPLLDTFAQRPAQFVFLGTGESRYQDPLRTAAESANNLVAYLQFDEPVAQQIYGASDGFLMPSRFEPCGLGQLIALRYGSVPVVRHVGGLADTIIDPTVDADRANGVVFEDYTPSAFLTGLDRAIHLYTQAPDYWRQMIQHGMSQSLGWDQSARAYESLYLSLLQEL